MQEMRIGRGILLLHTSLVPSWAYNGEQGLRKASVRMILALALRAGPFERL
jgi:hypothetical protein